MENRRKYRILVADDEDTVCEIVKRYLSKRMDAEIVTVESGEEAVHAARDMRPDLMFLDVTLLGALNGWQIVEEVRKFDKHTRIVMVSGNGSVPEQYAEMAKREVSEYLQKPVQLEALYRVAFRVLGGAVHETAEYFVPGETGVSLSADKIAHDLSNIQMTIQLHCAHFLSSLQDGYFKGATAEKVLKDVAESFETIQRKCVDLERIISEMRTPKGKRQDECI